MIYLCRAGHVVRKEWQTSTNDCPQCRRNERRKEQRRLAKIRAITAAHEMPKS